MKTVETKSMHLHTPYYQHIFRTSPKPLVYSFLIRPAHIFIYNSYLCSKNGDSLTELSDLLIKNYPQIKLTAR